MDTFLNTRGGCATDWQLHPKGVGAMCVDAFVAHPLCVELSMIPKIAMIGKMRKQTLERCLSKTILDIMDDLPPRFVDSTFCGLYLQAGHPLCVQHSILLYITMIGKMPEKCI